MNKKVGPFRDCYYDVMDEDLWPEILKRLPIKSLGQFLIVCKMWNSLISSAFFINLQLSVTRSTTPCNLKPYLHLTFRQLKSKRLKTYTLFRPLHSNLKPYLHLTFRQLKSKLLKTYTLFRPLHTKQRLHCPFQAEEDTDHDKIFTFVDVIHGVVCISYSWYSTLIDQPSSSSNSVLLWNPSIHKYVVLPCISLDRHFKAIGFGYDASKNDFKVVLISDEPVRGVVTYQVYSALQGFWRPPVTTTAGIVNHLTFETHDHNCCFVNGTIHWLIDVSDYGSDDDDDDDDVDVVIPYSLLMFDCELEEFTSIGIPEKLFWSSSGHGPFKVELLEYAGMLAALVEDTNDCTHLLVMEEHGVSNSWKKLYTIRPGYSNEERIWYSNEERITIYDPSFEDPTPYGPNNQKWIKCGHYCGDPFRRIMRDHVYEESMFLMDHPKVQSYTKKEIVQF